MRQTESFPRTPRGVIPVAAQVQVIDACVNKKGSMRVVNDPAECKVSETPLSWNQQGPPGEPGMDGMDGEPGEPGPEGRLGPSLRAFDLTGSELGIFIGRQLSSSNLEIYHVPSGVVFTVDRLGRLADPPPTAVFYGGPAALHQCISRQTTTGASCSAVPRVM